jgi:hypothetical protein
MSFVGEARLGDPLRMPGQRLALPAATRPWLPLAVRAREALAFGLACVWWVIRAQVADRHRFPPEAVEPPPAAWLSRFRMPRP